MSRTTMAKVDENGILHVKLPASMRKQVPAGSAFALQTNGCSITLTPVYLPGQPLDEESRKRFLEAINRIREYTERNNITAADMRRTLRHVRRERRAQAQGRTR